MSCTPTVYFHVVQFDIYRSISNTENTLLVGTTKMCKEIIPEVILHIYTEYNIYSHTKTTRQIFSSKIENKYNVINLYIYIGIELNVSNNNYQ